MASNIDSIEIFPSENGGHRVLHNFKREAGQEGRHDARPFEGTHQRVYTAYATCRDSWHPRAEFWNRIFMLPKFSAESTLIGAMEPSQFRPSPRG